VNVAKSVSYIRSCALLRYDKKLSILKSDKSFCVTRVVQRYHKHIMLSQHFTVSCILNVDKCIKKQDVQFASRL